MENELYHHGVKGQHWGKRNGPPYPLYRKSAYYKKTGQRPPGYTGNKSGKGVPSTKGKIGKLPDDMKGYRKINSDDMTDVNFVKKYNKIKPRKEDAESYAEVAKNLKKGAGNRVLSTIPIMTSAAFLGRGLASRDKSSRRLYLGGAALTGGIGLAQNIIGRRQQKKAVNQATELTNKMIKQSKVKDIKAYDGQLYVKDKRGSIGGLSDIKRAGDTSWVRKRLKKGKIGGINDSTSDEERKAKLKKRILIGAGVAAGLAGGALVGRKLYQRKAALGAQGVAEEAKNLHKNFLKNRAAQKEATSIKEGLDKAYQNSSKAIKAERAGIINKKLSLQNEGLGLKDAKGIRAYFKRRKNAKALNEIEQRLAANTTKSANATKNYSKKLADNAWNADNASANYERAKKVYERAKASEAALKKLGNKQALASTLGLGALGGAAGYGTSKLLRSKNQNKGTIGGIPKRLAVSSTDSAVTRRAKQNYNTMSDAEFRRRFSVSKETYAKRVEKYGDPYMNSPLAKLGKRLSRRRRRR